MQKFKISEIKLNPNNPRLIKDDKFEKLVKSIKEFPEMLDIRPIVVNRDMFILGGNMRFKACKEAGLKEIPVIVADNLTEEQQREFLIKDNTSGGEWDFEMLANEWDVEQLEEWGLDIPVFDLEPSYDDLIGEEKNKPATLKITFESPEQLQKAEIDIQELIDRKYNGAYFSVSAGEI
jgi:ParB-like chromosome segregation protein Spo0J